MDGPHRHKIFMEIYTYYDNETDSVAREKFINYLSEKNVKIDKYLTKHGNICQPYKPCYYYITACSIEKRSHALQEWSHAPCGRVD